MKFILIAALCLSSTVIAQDYCNSTNAASTQLLCFKQENPSPIGEMSLMSGAPVQKKWVSLLNDKNIIRNPYFLDTMDHILTENIPVRKAHPSGTGAFGYFKLTNDISTICKADLFTGVGKTTPVVVRLSSSTSQPGAPDSSREARGLAIKFKTNQGNWDLATLTVPTFPFKDPALFPSFSHISRNPVTRIADPNKFWDFVTQFPESLNTILRLFSDDANPAAYQNAPFYGVHTFQLENASGKTRYARFYLVPDAGVVTLNLTQAATLGASDPSFLSRRLYNAIASGNYPTWTLYIQALTVHDRQVATTDIFDVTRTLSTDDYPLKEVGKLVLNENIENHFKDVEQAAYCPGNLVPGILGAPDKLFEARAYAYKRAAHHRLGINFPRINVNKPIQGDVYSYNRDGNSPVSNNGADSPDFYPNSFNGPYVSENIDTTELTQITQDPAPSNFDQAKKYYEEEINDTQRATIAAIIANGIGNAADFIQTRAFTVFEQISSTLATNVKNTLAAAAASG